MTYNYYFVQDHSGQDLCLENLSTHNNIRVRFISDNELENPANGKKAKICRILPDEFHLSRFGNGRYPYVEIEREQILYDLAAELQLFTEQTPLSQNSIIALTDWK